MDHHNFEGWVAAGRTTLQDRATVKVRRLIEAPHAPVLPSGVLGVLQAIVGEADTAADSGLS
jgi:trimethylamine:corrinoid methyltransferase-like protein